MSVLYIVIDAIDLTVAIAIKVALLLTTETNKVSGVEKSQIKNIAEISPCVPFGHLVEMTIQINSLRKQGIPAPARPNLSRKRAHQG
mgnify:CR=1 FL=1